MPPAKKRVTIKDIGREAGVSWTTVSRVLTGGSFSERISPETKARILEISRRLGYRPNVAGVALKKGYTNTVALLTVEWDVATANSRPIMRVTRIAQEHGLSTTIHIAADDNEGKSLLDTFRTMKPYGVVVLWDSEDIPVGELSELRAEGVPVVDLMPRIAGGPVSITWDVQQGFQTGVRFLHGLGHNRIGLMRPSGPSRRTTVAKLAGYLVGLSEAGIDYDEGLIQDVTGEGFEHGYEGLSELIQRRPDVTAVMCMHDPVAVGVIAAIKDLGMDVPSDISVTGYGAYSGWMLIPPKLTTMSTQATPLARKVVDYLVRMREDSDCVLENVCEPMALITAGSTARVNPRRHSAGS